MLLSEAMSCVCVHRHTDTVLARVPCTGDKPCEELHSQAILACVCVCVCVYTPTHQVTHCASRVGLEDSQCSLQSVVVVALLRDPVAWRHTHTHTQQERVSPVRLYPCMVPLASRT